MNLSKWRENFPMRCDLIQKVKNRFASTKNEHGPHALTHTHTHTLEWNKNHIMSDFLHFQKLIFFVYLFLFHWLLPLCAEDFDVMNSAHQLWRFHDKKNHIYFFSRWVLARFEIYSLFFFQNFFPSLPKSPSPSNQIIRNENRSQNQKRKNEKNEIRKI